MEMIKGIPGHGYHDELVVRIIENAAHESQLRESLTEVVFSFLGLTAEVILEYF